MDVLEFAEQILDYKLHPFQKEYLRLLDSGKKVVCMPARHFGLQLCRESIQKYQDQQLKYDLLIVDDVEHLEQERANED